MAGYTWSRVAQTLSGGSTDVAIPTNTEEIYINGSGNTGASAEMILRLLDGSGTAIALGNSSREGHTTGGLHLEYTLVASGNSDVASKDGANTRSFRCKIVLPKDLAFVADYTNVMDDTGNENRNTMGRANAATIPATLRFTTTSTLSGTMNIVFKVRA